MASAMRTGSKVFFAWLISALITASCEAQSVCSDLEFNARRRPKVPVTGLGLKTPSQQVKSA